jgi:lysozyme
MVSVERLVKELSQEEGVEHTIYKCTAGHKTIGIGHNLDAENIDKIIGRKLADNPKLSDAEIKLVFQHDLNKVTNDLDSKLPWWRNLPVPAAYVVLSLTFNMGIGGQISKNPIKYNGLRGFVNTLKEFEEHDFKAAAAGLRASKWFKQVGRRGVKITTILETGKFPDGKSE